MVKGAFLLDTDTVIAMLKGQYNIQEHIVEVGFEKCSLSAITLAELYTGAFKTDNPDHFKQLDFIERNFNVLPFGSSRIYGRIRALLEKEGLRLDDMDLLIAGTALEKGMTLVTHNVKHFSRIPDLIVKDWMKI